MKQAGEHADLRTHRVLRNEVEQKFPLGHTMRRKGFCFEEADVERHDA